MASPSINFPLNRLGDISREFRIDMYGTFIALWYCIYRMIKVKLSKRLYVNLHLC